MAAGPRFLPVPAAVRYNCPPNESSPTMEIRNGTIYIGDVSARELARTYGTPTYVYDEEKIRRNYRRILETFTRYYDDFRLCYAVKGNDNLAVAHILRQEGAGIDAASANEILLAKELGLGGEDVIFSGNFLSDEDIAFGLASGVIFNLDDSALLPRLLRFGKPDLICFRVNPGYGRSNIGHYVTNAGPEAKFGIHPDQVLDVYRQAHEAGINRFGVHMMPGSCVTDADYFPYVVGLLMDIVGAASAKLGISFEFIDLGGGLGIPYAPDETPLDLDTAARKTVEVFEQKLGEYGLPAPRLIMEPARAIVGDAGYIVGRVHSIKEGYRRIIGTDVGMNVLARPAMYGAYHHVYVDGKEDGDRLAAGLCGQICENTDFWIKEREFPADIAEGDVVVVENAGAYGFVMSYRYNGRLRPAEVLVCGDRHELIRTREGFEDLIRGVRVPRRLEA